MLGHIRRTRIDTLIMSGNLRRVSALAPLQPRVTVSLTTFGHRIRWAHYAIASIMIQTVRPERIVLWLPPALESPARWPRMLRELTHLGLEIRSVPDLGPATKLLPALREFPDDVIITIDDDQIYDHECLDRLLCAHRRHPQAVCANWCEAVGLNSRGELVKIRKSEFGPADGPRPDLLAKGMAGVLYPPGCMNPAVMDTDLLMKLSPKADDLWFKAMQMLKGTPVVSTHKGKPQGSIVMANENYPEHMALRDFNVAGGGDDRQLLALQKHFHLHTLL